MLKWHLIGNWGENYLFFVIVGVKNKSFANAYEHYGKKKMQYYAQGSHEQNSPVP